MKCLRIFFGVLFFLFLLAPARGESRTIEVGLYDNRPMIFMEDGQPKGLFIDILEHIAKQEGWDIHYVYNSWEVVFDKLEKGEIDLLPVVAWSEARSGRMDYTQKSLLVNWGQVYVGNDLEVDAIESLRDKKIAIQPNCIHGEHFCDLMEKLNIGFSRVLIADYHDIFEALEEGAVHAGVVNKVFASVNEEAFQVRSTPIVFNPIQIRYAVPKGDPAGLLPALDRHLGEQMEASGAEYKSSMAKWFGHGKVSLLPSWLKEAILLTSSLGVFFLFLIHLLRSQVAAKTRELQISNDSLRESEQKLRLHLESTQSVPWEYDLKSQSFTHVGSQSAQVFGYSPEALADLRAWQRAVHPDDRAWVLEYCRTKIAKGRNFEVEYRVVTPDNRVMWVRGIVAVLSGPDGAVRLNGFCRDITEVKEAAETLRKSETRFRQLVENIAEVVWEVDGQGRFTYVSPNVLSLSGVTPVQLVGKNFSCLMPPEETKRVVNILAKGKEARKHVLKLEHMILHRDGRRLYFESTGTSILSSRGELLGYQGTSIDRTERVETERDVQTLVENTVGIIGQKFFVSVAGTLCDWLDCHCALIGEISEDGEIHPLAMVVDGKSASRPICRLHGSPWEETALTSYFVCKEGLRDRFSDNPDLAELEGEGFVGTSLTNKRGETIGVLGCLSRRPLQITRRTKDVLNIISARVSAEIERRNAEAEKKRLEAKLQQAHRMETIGTLAGGIAHDFNNLLFPMIGHAEMVREDLPEGSPLKRSLNEIHSAALRARDLVKQILTFSRQEANDARPMEIQAVLKEALKLMRSSVPATIAMSQDICQSCGFIEADPTQIHQVVMNLTTNAYHAMEESGGVMTVTLKEVQVTGHALPSPVMLPGRYACLTVADTGSGMSRQLQEKIFDPFFTTKESGKGTGMGLSVVHGIVKRLEGGIQVTSEPGKGTDICVYFPVTDQGSSIQTCRQPPTAVGGTERILLVDDEASIVDIERQMLERMGYQVSPFTSCTDAMAEFRADPGAFDLVISDLNMPDLPGDQFASELIKIRPDIPVLLCTGFSDKLTEEKAAAMGIRAFLMKPVAMTDLSEKVREVLMESDGDKNDKTMPVQAG